MVPFLFSSPVRSVVVVVVVALLLLLLLPFLCHCILLLTLSLSLSLSLTLFLFFRYNRIVSDTLLRRFYYLFLAASLFSSCLNFTLLVTFISAHFSILLAEHLRVLVSQSGHHHLSSLSLLELILTALYSSLSRSFFLSFSNLLWLICNRLDKGNCMTKQGYLEIICFQLT